MTQRFIFAGPATLGNASLIVVAPIGIIAAAISDMFADASTRFTWLLAGGVAQVCLTAVVLLGGRLGAGRRRTTVVLTVVIAAATRALVIIGFIPVLGARDPLPAADRFVGATVTLSMWLLLVGVGVQAVLRSREQLRNLLMRVDIALAEADALQRTFSAQMNGAATRSAQDLTQLARNLHEVIDQKLRPLSHRLWFGVTSPHLWRRMLGRVAGEPVPVLPVASLLAVSLAWNSLLRFDALTAIEATIVNIGLLAVVLLLGQWGIRQLPVPAEIAQPITVILAVLVSSLAVAVFPFSIGSSARDDVGGLIGVAATNLVVLALSMVISADRRAHAESMRKLTLAVDDLEPRRRAAASFLHNSINSSWRALAMQVDAAVQIGDLEQARSLLHQMSIVSTRESFIDYERGSFDRLNEVPARWEGLAHVSIDVDGVVPANLGTPISGLIDEAITNAVRHGRARHIEAFITVSVDHVDVVVVDDGTTTVSESASGSSTPGLGSSWLDSQAEWSRESGPDGTRLTVCWPCLPSPGSSDRLGP